MGKITEPAPVKLFFGMLSQEPFLFDELQAQLADTYGPVDLESAVWPWDHSQYYEQEMGTGLKRKFLFFKNLIYPGALVGIKLKTNELEKLSQNENSGRKINVDPGYLDAAKLVLATTKDFSHRIYLDKGIYGEVTLYYSRNNYQTLPYTFPDYRTEKYIDIFRKAREIYKIQMKTKNP
jgi:hypothetical protein